MRARLFATHVTVVGLLLGSCAQATGKPVAGDEDGGAVHPDASTGLDGSAGADASHGEPDGGTTPALVSPIEPGEPADVGETPGSWSIVSGHVVTRWAKDVTPATALKEYPRPTMVREAWASLNGLWDYAITPLASAEPSTWEGKVLVPYPIESALSGVARALDDTHRLWLTREFHVPEGWDGQRVILHFDAVDHQADVYVNGSKVGSHTGGYDRFSFDVTDQLHGGNEQLVVSVADPSDRGLQPYGKQVLSPGGIFYTATSGIWQPVWLEPVADASLESLSIVPDLDQRLLHVSSLARGGSEGVTWTVTAYAEGVEAGRAQGSLGTALDVPIPSPRLWTLSAPFLYDLIIELSRDGKVIDRVGSYAGMRKIEVKADAQGIARPMLNGEFVFHFGLLDQGYWPDGLYTPATDEALRWDVEQQKELGFTMIRKHAKVEPERFYTWCDRLGIMVWQDMPSTRIDKSDTSQAALAARTQFQTELTSMIHGRGNHPSIVQWVVFNEGWGNFDIPQNTQLAKELDPSRLVNAMSGYGFVGGDTGVGDLLDQHDYTDPRPAAPAPQAGRFSAIGELGGLGLLVSPNSWNDVKCCYVFVDTSAQLTHRLELLFAALRAQVRSPGLSAAVYTELSDVEDEKNGLYTYDREQLKVDAARIKRAIAGVVSPPALTTLLGSADQGTPATWRYVLSAPASTWYQNDFDASSWAQGTGGFGALDPPNTSIGTSWTSSDIWMRTTFTLTSLPANPLLHFYHDEAVEIYLNGVQVRSAADYFFDYLDVPFETDSSPLVLGSNVLAVHCKQTDGGQYVDVGLVSEP